ncbi:MAG: putative nuclease with RNAse H fold [Bacteroidia bacterium]|jgi:predicted nuclease with RNAse H fold
METVVGIDYGSKLAGTTVIAYYQKDMVRFRASKHQEDADKFIVEHLKLLKPKFVFLDAPLSLPGKYVDKESYSDYFYRVADRELGAMSPMFLGGLTARAMKLRDYLEKMEITVFETYPKQQAVILELEDGMYKRDDKYIIELSKVVSEKFSLNVNHDQMKTWHHFDSLLAYIAGIRFLNKAHLAIGDKKEGQIIV